MPPSSDRPSPWPPLDPALAFKTPDPAEPQPKVVAQLDREDQEELIWSWVYGLRRPDLANASRARIEALYNALVAT